MKISFILCLVVLVIFTVTQLCSSYEKRVNQGYDLLLGGDDDECCQQNGSNIIIEKPGLLEIILDGGNELVFEICSMNCTADFLVCYEADPPKQNVVPLCDSKCGFYVTTLNDSISVMKTFEISNIGRPKLDKCDIFKMQNGATPFRKGYVTTCAPKIDENGLVKLNVTNASSDCPVIILNATIMLETTTTPAPTKFTTITASVINNGTKSGGSGTGTTEAPGTFFKTYWWIFVIIVLLVIGFIVAGILIYCFKFKKSKKPTPPHSSVAARMPQGPKSPAVLQASTEHVKSRNIPTSILEPSSIISRKSVLEMAKKEEDAKQEETDLASLKP